MSQGANDAFSTKGKKCCVFPFLPYTERDEKLASQQLQLQLQLQYGNQHSSFGLWPLVLSRLAF